MLLAKIMLALTATTWILYGGWLFVDPTGLRYAGFALDNWSTIVEVQAMYGAAEIMLGVFALLGLLQPKRYMHSALLLWCMIYTGLAIGRVVGLLSYDGDFLITLGPEGLPNSYNAGALYFLELPSAILLAIALKKTAQHPDLA